MNLPATAGLPTILPDTPAGSLALAAAVAASAQASQPDTVLLDLGRRWSALAPAWQRFDDDAPQSETTTDSDARLMSLMATEREITVAITAVPATTFASLAVKARVLIREASAEDFPANEAELLAHADRLMRNGCSLDEMVGSLCLDLLRLAQETGR